MKGRKKWLTALLAALSAAIAALVQLDAAPHLDTLAPLASGQDVSAVLPESVEPRQCASNWLECPPTP